MVFILVHHAENDPEVKKRRIKEGLEYPIDMGGGMLLRENKPRDTCFYDDEKLVTHFRLDDGYLHKSCPHCLFAYQVPPSEEELRN